ncbi:MAG: ABC transporter permease subunit [Gallintestinimicrobium sp.]
MDPTLYEAAAVDGAGRFRRIWHITLPGIRMTVALLAILALGNILNAGFDQIYNLYNPLVIFLPVILLIPGFTDMVFRTCSFHLQLRLVCSNLLSA